MMKKVFCLLLTISLIPGATLQAATPEWQRHKITGDYLLKTGQPVLAAHEYRKALNLNSQASDIYFNLAIACYANRDLGGAIAALESLTILEPADIEAFYNLGCLYLYDERIEQAKKYFKKAKSISSNDSLFVPLIAQGLEFAEELFQSPSQGLMLYLLNHGLASALPFQEPDKGLGT